MKRLLPAILALAVVWALPACQSETMDNSNPVDPRDDNGQMNPPDDGVSFSMQVAPILSTCGSAGCHGSAATSGVRVTSHAALMASVGQQYGSRVVVPGSASSSPLVDKISSSSPQFGQRMPLGQSALSSSAISTIRTWIDEGAKNN